MMKYVLKSLGGANAIAQTAVLELPTYPTQINVRGLLFLFFGITFLEDHQINPDPDQGNVLAYQVVLSEATMDLPNYQYLLLTALQILLLSPGRCLSAQTHSTRSPDIGAWRILLHTTSMMSVRMAERICQHP